MAHPKCSTTIQQFLLPILYRLSKMLRNVIVSENNLENQEFYDQQKFFPSLFGTPISIKGCFDLKGLPTTFGVISRLNQYKDSCEVIKWRSGERSNHKLKMFFFRNRPGDKGGGIRVPSSFCEIYGLRPSGKEYRTNLFAYGIKSLNFFNQKKNASKQYFTINRGTFRYQIMVKIGIIILNSFIYVEAYAIREIIKQKNRKSQSDKEKTQELIIQIIIKQNYMKIRQKIFYAFSFLWLNIMISQITKMDAQLHPIY